MQEKTDDDVMVTLSLEDGSEMKCEILTIFEVQGRDYIALVPVDEQEKPLSDDTVYLYRYNEDEDGTPSVDNILSDEEFELVEEKYNELCDEAEFRDMD